MDLEFSKSIIQNVFFVSLTLLCAVVANSVLRHFVKFPANIENRRQKTLISVIRNVISILVYAIALYVIFGLLDINIAPLLASAGIIGLSIGMGARPLIEDLIGGVTLLSQDSIAIGDEVDIDGSVGRIEKIGFRTLTIRAKDGSLHIIPNGMVKKVINHSRESKGKPSSALRKAKK
jgi:moderate conductance mechanosensitive channel